MKVQVLIISLLENDKCEELMQFSNQYIMNTIKDAHILQGNCPPTLSLSFDSKNTKEGEVFCFLETTTSDNEQNMLEQLLMFQVSGIIISEKKVSEIMLFFKKTKKTELFILMVPQVLSAIHQLARAIRLSHNETTVIAISGTGGTKITQTVLADILHNQNREIVIVQNNETHGTLAEVSRIIINTCSKAKIILFEALSLKRYDIKTIADITRPSYAIINSVGHYKIDTIGSLHDVATEQRDIFSFFTEKNIGVINGDQKELSEISYSHPIIKFGLKVFNQIQARKIQVINSKAHCVLKIYKNKYPIILQNGNPEILSSILSATAMAKLLGISDDNIISVIQKSFHITRCFEIKKINFCDGIIIDDTYSSDPESVKAALIAFQHVETRGPKIIILGDMEGLGISSAFWHRQIGRFLRKVPSLSHLFVIGQYGEYTTKTAPKQLHMVVAQKWQELIPQLKKYFYQKPVILIKGNNTGGLHQLINQLCNN